MGGSIVLNLIKVTLIGVVGILISINVWQANAVEDRVQQLQVAVRDVEGKIDDVARSSEETARRVRTGAVVPTGTDSAPGVVEPERDRDPRTLPYWPTEDNILIDLTNEPRPPADAPHGGTIYYYTRSNPRSFNVHVLNEAELQERIVGPIYEKIAPQSKHDFDAFIPGICNRVTVNEDFTEYTCYVRKGRFWHEPYLTEEERSGTLNWLARMPRQEITAEDIKFTFDIVKDPLAECGSEASYLKEVESVEVIDRYTVKIRWKRKLYYNKGTTLDLLFIYPKWIYERDESGAQLDPELIAPSFPKHWFDKRMCGSGPFQFAGFADNQFIRMRRNDEWWSPCKPVIDEVYLHIQEKPEILLDMFKSGKLDVYYASATQYRTEYLENGELGKGVASGKYSFTKHQTFAYYYVGWNLRHPPFRERAVRRALAHLCDKERMLRDVWYGLAVPHDSPVHQKEANYVQDLEPFPYDVERAKKLLDEAGWRMGPAGVREKVVDGQTVQLRAKLIYPTASPTLRDIVFLYQKGAEQAGVILEPVGREWQAMIKQLDDKQFEASCLGWGNSWDSDPSQIWHSESAKSANGSNYGWYLSQEVDDAIEALKLEFDIPTRRKLSEKFQRTVAGDQPYCFVAIPARPWFVNNRLGNQQFQTLRPQDWFIPWFVKKP